MLVLKLQPTKRAKRYLDRTNLDAKAMETVLNFFIQPFSQSRKLRFLVLHLDIDCRRMSSECVFGANLIVLTGIHTVPKRRDSLSAHTVYIFHHLMHEFRHFIQDVIFKKTYKDITYDLRDVKEETMAYVDNKLEIDANKFERYATKKALRIYKLLLESRVPDSVKFNW